MTVNPKLLECPFCGGSASFEEVDRLGHIAWTVGCNNMSADCIGTQMITIYSRKAEAAEAWNTRGGVSITPIKKSKKKVYGEAFPEFIQKK